jgi:hypothetical protein
MEIKGLNQKQVAAICNAYSNEIEKPIRLLCPILLDDNELRKTINYFVFGGKISQEYLLGILLETYDYIPFENLENLITVLNGFKIISHENNFSSSRELDEYFEHQLGQIKLTKNNKQLKISYQNESDINLPS